jgi:hypothetical protein
MREHRISVRYREQRMGQPLAAEHRWLAEPLDSLGETGATPYEALRKLRHRMCRDAKQDSVPVAKLSVDEGCHK